MRRRAILVLTAALAAGCASVPSAPPELQVAALTFTPAPGMVRIYVYRSGGAFGSASRLSVAIDSQIVGRTAPGTYLMVELSPGRHRVSSATPENESGVVLDTQADSVYFVKVWPRMGLFSAHSGMERMEPTEARRGIGTARMVVSTWPGTPIGGQP
ncbi:MAG TPA: DUF2846 domain-containing protein [Gemmatimonadales bacterium]